MLHYIVNALAPSVRPFYTRQLKIADAKISFRFQYAILL